MCAGSALAATFAARAAWCQVPSAPPPPPDYDEVEQKPLPPEHPLHPEEDETPEPPPQVQEDAALPAQEPVSRFEFGVRSGAGIPIGAAVKGGAEISSLVASQIPVWLDVGARLRGGFFFGVHASYGFGNLSGDIKTACDQDRAAGASVDCNAHDVRAGLELLYHVRTSPIVDLWFGGGFGWEWLNFSASEAFQGQSATITEKMNGMQLVMLQMGADFELLPGLGIGPFIALSNDMYFTTNFGCRGSCEGIPSQGATISEKTSHQWVFIGARVSFRP